MPKTKQPKLTQEELFPHGKEFGYRLQLDEVIEGLGTIAWFQCEFHLTKHVERYRITKGKIDVMTGAAPMSRNPLEPKKRASRTKASQTTKAKKPVKTAAKTKSAPRTSKTAKKEVFSNLDTFFSK
jgi:uncharacterized surface anchored protein